MMRTMLGRLKRGRVDSPRGLFLLVSGKGSDGLAAGRARGGSESEAAQVGTGDMLDCFPLS